MDSSKNLMKIKTVPVLYWAGYCDQFIPILLSFSVNNSTLAPQFMVLIIVRRTSVLYTMSVVVRMTDTNSEENSRNIVNEKKCKNNHRTYTNGAVHEYANKRR